MISGKYTGYERKIVVYPTMRKWNKLLAMLLAMVMVFGLTATAFAAEGDAAGVVSSFLSSSPSAGVVSSFLSSSLSAGVVSSESKFSDTKDSYVAALVEMGVINGNPDGTFDPDGALTRGLPIHCRLPE